MSDWFPETLETPPEIYLDLRTTANYARLMWKAI